VLQSIHLLLPGSFLSSCLEQAYFRFPVVCPNLETYHHVPCGPVPQNSASKWRACWSLTFMKLYFERWWTFIPFACCSVILMYAWTQCGPFELHRDSSFLTPSHSGPHGLTLWHASPAVLRTLNRIDWTFKKYLLLSIKKHSDGFHILSSRLLTTEYINSTRLWTPCLEKNGFKPANCKLNACPSLDLIVHLQI
jgi:hypothetical protein